MAMSGPLPSDSESFRRFSARHAKKSPMVRAESQVTGPIRRLPFCRSQECPGRHRRSRTRRGRGGLGREAAPPIRLFTMSKSRRFLLVHPAGNPDPRCGERFQDFRRIRSTSKLLILVQLFSRKFATTHAADMGANFRPAALVWPPSPQEAAIGIYARPKDRG
jgi:hypothetical protein